MNVIIKKRQIIMSALVLALGSAVFVNWYFTKPQSEAAQSKADETKSYSVLGEAQYVSSAETAAVNSAGNDSLADQRLIRDKAHDDAFDKLNTVIGDVSAAKAAVDSAAEQLSQLTNSIKLEADLEALISAKCGFGCVAVINGESAQIICEKGKLNSTSILQIKETVIQHTGMTAENIIIFEEK